MTFKPKPIIRYFAAPAFGILMVLMLWEIFFVSDLLLSEYAFGEMTLGEDGFYYALWFLGLMPFLVFAWGYLHRAFHEDLYSSLRITAEEIRWQCPLRKVHRLSVSRCRYVSVQMKDSYNGLDYSFIVFSVHPYPADMVRKVNQVRVTDDTVKFWYSEDLAKYVIESFPREKTGGLQYYYQQQRKQRRKR